ncbi:metallophosphoesterase [Rubrolithibacter danxiaensis]|uniref:metallophosphoesterase n=1 Tax=Rubrolithibacter danxiaensis TaxID=3390805 RepID=UPI003BF7B0CD
MKIKKPVEFICLLFFLAIAAACTSTKPFYDKSQRNWASANPPDSNLLNYSVFLVGDVGKPDAARQEPTLKLLQQKIFNTDSISDTLSLNNSRSQDVVIFLGDNIYESGLPESDAADRKEKERRIIEQMKVVKNFKGKSIFVPGNHDWNEMKPQGLAAVNREEAFIEAYLDSNDVFLPSNGCPGPVEIQLNKNLVIIVLDTEWWLYKYKKPVAPDNGCTAGSRLEVIRQVKDILDRNKGKNILFAQHHPLFSNGTHGGYFSLKDYIFPLTLVRDNLWIPLPVIGSVYPLMRQYGISREDISNKDYQQLKRGLLSILQNEKNVVIAAGHEHALQLNKYNDLTHIISGAGSKRSSLVKGNGALFTHGTKGFARLNYYKNGQVWVEFWEPDNDGSKGTLVFRSPLYAIPPQKPSEVQEELKTNYSDSVKTIAAGKEYKASPFKERLFGEHYRASWAVPVKAEYLDLANFAGGLTPVKIGGGKQTTSLQLKGKDGNIYQFRTINKDPSTLLPEGFLKTFAEDFFQDQISSAHPYGALVVPDLAKAIGIYHTNPQLVYMPFSRLLGPYLQDVGGKLGIIEARPDDDVSDFNSFGNAKNAISTNKLYEKLKDDNDNEVDQQMFLKARLLDILIGDWDRHEDQWRWAEFKKDKGSIYKPIPRDRDQAFSKFDGVLPKLMNLVIPDFQSFSYEIKDVVNLSKSARNLDRNLLNKLSRQDWERISGELQKELSDSIIQKAVGHLPEEVYEISGEELVDKLKSRRDQLQEAAMNYYAYLSREVTIAGSDKKEFFKITPFKDSIIVSVFKIKDKKITDKLYERTFLPKETSAINIYALSGKDSVIIKRGTTPLKIRIVGGPGNDLITDSSNTGKRVLIYDSKSENNEIKKGANTATILSDKSWVNEYDVNSVKYDQRSITPAVDYNSEDGIFLGGGYSITHFGFKKEPASYIQSISGIYAPKTNAYTINYKGTIFSLFSRNTDLALNATLNGPKYTFSYYGQGNSSLNIGDNKEYYRVRSKNLSITSYIQHRFTSAFKIGMGPGFEYYKVEKPENRFVSDPAFPEQSEISAASHFGTLRFFTDIDFVDNAIFPTSGVRWKNEANYFKELKNNNYNFLQLSSTLSFYATPNTSIPVTAAIRLGAATNVGDYKFFQSNSLGGNTFLRGYRNNRFSGRSFLFQNTELRFKVTNIRNYFLTGNLGVFGFFDAGRVFSDNPEGNMWHTGYGPGVWFKLYNLLLVSSSYGFSKEGSYIRLKTGITF